MYIIFDDTKILKALENIQYLSDIEPDSDNADVMLNYITSQS
jgi:hypothetical protein